jgi:hypothetical protein
LVVEVHEGVEGGPGKPKIEVSHLKFEVSHLEFEVPYLGIFHVRDGNVERTDVDRRGPCVRC